MHSKPPQPPPLFNASLESLVPRMEQIVGFLPLLLPTTTHLLQREKCLSRFLFLARRLQRTLGRYCQGNYSPNSNFCQCYPPSSPLRQHYRIRNRYYYFYQTVSTSRKLRDASSEAKKFLNNFRVEPVMYEHFFQLNNAALSKKKKRSRPGASAITKN